MKTWDWGYCGTVVLGTLVNKVLVPHIVERSACCSASKHSYNFASIFMFVCSYLVCTSTNSS